MASKREHPASGATRRRLDPGARRMQLLEHAICAFADAGIERAAHADVAGRAQVSTPTVFKYFPTRDALVDAELTLGRGALASLHFYRARAARVGTGDERQINLIFRARVCDG